MQQDTWPSIAVLGAGAVGCYFGGMLARAGAPVTLIGRPLHVDAMSRNGLVLDSIQFHTRIPVASSTRVEAARDADLVLLSVKTPNTEETARDLVPHLRSGASVVSLQNGVDNVERIRAATTIEAIPAVVYVAAEMVAPGCVKHSGRGDLIIGDPSRRGPTASPQPSSQSGGAGGRDGDVRRGELERVAAVFARAGVPCKVSRNIEADLWTKLVMNCAYNAMSALSRARYGRIAANRWTRDVVRHVVEETLAVARAAGVQLDGSDLVHAAWTLGEAMPGALSSTAQDINRGKRTEIDSLNGYVARRGGELGIATPVNQTLYALVKLLEERVAPHSGTQLETQSL
jgi:2-dehydropantoate 2-reductase